MYPSSSSSLTDRSMGSSGLVRYGSAPSALFTSAVDSIINNTNQDFAAFGSSSSSTFSMAAPPLHPPAPNHHHHPHPQPSSAAHQHHYFSGGDWSSLTSESNCKVNPNTDLSPDPKQQPNKGRQRSSACLNSDLLTANMKIGGRGDGGNDGGGSSSNASNLIRHSSSPAGFLNHLMSENGFSVTRGSRSYTSRGGSNVGSGHGTSRLKSQLSFTRQDSSLSQISEVSENVIDGLNSNNGHRDSMHSYVYATDSWDNNGNSITFSSPSNKRAKSGDGHFLNCLNGTLESQFSLPQTSLEKATAEMLLQIPEDSVPCKIRAKRGCATHPRSIAERERRTRISGKLKKLQDLVPNMDKQTSYADMLDLAVQHIKGLQDEVEKLNKGLETCTCGCKPSET